MNTTPFFGINYQEALKKIQGIAPLIEKAKEYNNNGQTIKFKKEKDKIIEAFINNLDLTII